MSVPGDIATGLAFLPRWMNPAGTAFDSLFTNWRAAFGYSAVGIATPIEPEPRIVLGAVNAVESLPAPPAEWRDMATRLNDGAAVASCQIAPGLTRVYALATAAGFETALVWAEIAGAVTDADRNAVTLAARMIAASPTADAKFGRGIDSNRLAVRLADASIIAGRMAHDFDNILTGILGFADLTLPDLVPGTQAATFVAEIAKVGQRGIVFTQQLHQMSRSGQTKPQPGSIAAAVAKEMDRLRAASPMLPPITLDAARDLPPVAMEAGPLGVVIGHLIENAAEATLDGQPIAVRARPMTLSVSEAATYLGTIEPGDLVEITVTDHGTGIKPEVRARLFAEPFYTTKVRHRGLGLAIAFRTLSAHRGGIRIDAADPTLPGTTVRVVIPIASTRPAAAV
jgi:signal transduction histidine kinase